MREKGKVSLSKWMFLWNNRISRDEVLPTPRGDFGEAEGPCARLLSSTSHKSEDS